jgi:hypothetical protein
MSKKNTGPVGSGVVLGAATFLLATAKIEELESVP